MRPIAAFILIAALSLCLLASSPASAAFINVYGSPTFTLPGVGFTSGHALAINDAGKAVGDATKFDAGGFQGQRAVRWDSSGATELGNLGLGTNGAYTNVNANAINNAGTAVGYAEKYVAGAAKGTAAVRWDASGTAATELGNLGTDSSGNGSGLAIAINTAGTAVGFSQKYDGAGTWKGPRAVRWGVSGTAATELGNLGTDNSGFANANANAINTAGTAVGISKKYDFFGDDQGTRAVRWDASGTAATELGNLGTFGVFLSAFAGANSINDAGTAAGFSEKSDSFGNDLGKRAVRWDASGTAATELGNLGTDSAGFTYASANAINAAGTAVGFCQKYDGSGMDIGGRAVRWGASGTAATELGNLGTDPNGITTSEAYTINDGGFAVGYTEKYDGSGGDHGQVAVYWGPDSVAVDLNDLIDPSSGWTLQYATAISNTGWIAGGGLFDPDGPGGQDAYQRGFSMQIPATAVPEPAFVVPLSLICGISLLRRRRIH